MGLTTDRNDPDLGYGSNDEPTGQNKKYLILSEEERAKGFIRPVRKSYVHSGPSADNKGCNQITTMAQALAETYARDPEFYGATYCAYCLMHKPINEFLWIEEDGSWGPVLGS